MAKIGGSIGVWLGVYIPVAVMVIMGVLSFLKVGIQAHSVLGSFSPMKLLPTDTSSLKYVGAIAFIFTGIETAGVYVPRLKEATKNFSRGLIVALIGLIFLNIVNAFFVADVVPKGSTQLTNITQPILIFCHILGWPTIIANIFSLLAFIGVILQLSAWVTGPSQTIIQVAKEGLIPAKWHFQRENKYGVSKNVVLTQSICISLFALMYALPNINTVFLTLVNTTTLLYCIIYLFIGIAFIKLRYSKADVERPYRVGKNGNGLAWTMTVMFLFGIILIGIVSLVSQPLLNAVIMLVITVVLTIIPIIIDKFKKDEWYTDAQEDLKNNK